MDTLAGLGRLHQLLPVFKDRLCTLVEILLTKHIASFIVSPRGKTHLVIGNHRHHVTGLPRLGISSEEDTERGIVGKPIGIGDVVHKD